MTGPKPVKLPDITIRRGNVNPIEVALRLSTADPETQAIGQQNFRVRRKQFGQDFPKAVPGGMVGMLSQFLTDVVSLDAPLMPPVLPGVSQYGTRKTEQLTAALDRLLGATPGSEGTQTGHEVGGILASAIPIEGLLPLAGKAAGGLYDVTDDAFRGIGAEFKPLAPDVKALFRRDRRGIDPLAGRPPAQPGYARLEVERGTGKILPYTGDRPIHPGDLAEWRQQNPGVPPSAVGMKAP